MSRRRELEDHLHALRDISGILRAMKNPHLLALAEACFADEELVRLLKQAPGAKTIHHPYLSGLLEHTLSLFNNTGAAGRSADNITFLAAASVCKAVTVSWINREMGWACWRANAIATGIAITRQPAKWWRLPKGPYVSSGPLRGGPGDLRRARVGRGLGGDQRRHPDGGRAAARRVPAVPAPVHAVLHAGGNKVTGA